MLLQNLQAISSRVPATSGLKSGSVFRSYADLAERAARLAGGLASLGVEWGNVVAIALPNGPDLFALSYALFGLGAVAMPLSISAPPLELASYMRRGGARAVIGRAEAEPALRTAISAYSPGGDVPLILSGSGSATSLEMIANSPATRLAPLSPDDVALYLFSSGSTGLPKVVPHTHGEMIANGQATAIDFALHPGDVVFNNLPGNHAMGFLNSVFEVPEAGASTLYFSDPNAVMLARRRILDTLEGERVTVLPGIPFLFDALSGDSGPHNLSALRLVYSAGIALKRPTFERFRERFGHDIRQAYGCTEAGHVAFNRGDDVDALWDSVGKPVGDTSVTVQSIDPGTGLGELMLRSSSLTEGYLGMGALGSSSFPGGWFASGDLGRIDSDGNIFINGRAKLIVEIAGHKVDPLEVEEVLNQHPAIAEAVVVGVASGRAGEQRLKAVVVRRLDVTADVIIAFGKARLAPQKVPTIVEFIDAIPKSASGKVLRGRLMDG
ncbi:MAG: class I adenylate-forming enzyme family protein [Devosia sp.]